MSNSTICLVEQTINDFHEKPFRNLTPLSVLMNCAVSFNLSPELGKVLNGVRATLSR